MPTGRVLYVPEAAQGRLVCLGQEVRVRAGDVAHDARRPGTRVRFDLQWEDEDVRAVNVWRTRLTRARERSSPTSPAAEGPARGGTAFPPAATAGPAVEGGSER